MRNVEPITTRWGRRLACAVAATSIIWMAPKAAQGAYSCTVLYPVATVLDGLEAPLPTSCALGQTIGSATVDEDNNTHAVIWNAPSGSVVDLNPPGFGDAEGWATSGTQQVGFGMGTVSQYHALLWSGAAASAVDLNPTNLPGVTQSEAFGTDGTQQVGFISGNQFYEHAALWSGTAASAVDLNPAKLTAIISSVALATDTVQQVGYGAVSEFTYHAMVWSGTGASAVDLNPAGFINSEALAVSDGQQVGYASTAMQSGGQVGHAMLWLGTAGSAVDLNPTSRFQTFYSEALGTNGNQQVGWADDSAYLWSGSAASAVDLALLLPTTSTWDDSTAYSIDAAGNVYGIAQGTVNGVYEDFAVEWSPVPEPASFSLLSVASAGLLLRRKRARGSRLTCISRRS